MKDAQCANQEATQALPPMTSSPVLQANLQRSSPFCTALAPSTSEVTIASSLAAWRRMHSGSASLT